MALIVVFVFRRLGAAVCCPVGLLEAGASGVAASVGIVGSYFAITSDAVSIAVVIDKFAVGADNHESARVVILVNASLQGVVAFAEVGPQGIACYVSRLVCKVEFEIFHAFFRRGDRFVIIPVVPVNSFCGHLFTRNQVLPFIFRFEIPERRIVGVFVLENLFATFLVVAGVWIGGSSNHGFTPAGITIRTLVYVALVFHLLWIGAFSTSDGTFVVILVERVAGIFTATFGHLLAFFAAGNSRVEILVFCTSLNVVEAFAAVRSFFVTRDRAAGAVHDDSLLAFLDDADAKETVGAAVRVAVVAF